MLMSTGTIDELEQRLLHLESLVSQIRAAQVDVIAELDQAQVCTVDGARTLGEWVTGRLDVAPETGKALAYAAISESRALEDDLAAGDVSFDRVVATRRLANTGVDEATLRRAGGVGVEQVRRLTARNIEQAPQDETTLFGMRRLSAQPNLDNTAWNLRGRLSATDGEHVFKALEDTADRLVPAGGPYRPTLPQRRADALVAWAMNTLDPNGAGGEGPAVSTRLAATVHIDAETAVRTQGNAGAVTRHGVKVGPNTLQEILCGGTVSVVYADADAGDVMNVDVTASAIPPRVRDYVWHRDGGCTIAGCTSRYRLEPHHIVQQADRIDHHPDNLTLLCWYHHHVVIHQQDFTLDPDTPPGRRRLIRSSPDRDPPDT